MTPEIEEVRHDNDIILVSMTADPTTVEGSDVVKPGWLGGGSPARRGGSFGGQTPFDNAQVATTPFDNGGSPF